MQHRTRTTVRDDGLGAGRQAERALRVPVRPRPPLSVGADQYRLRLLLDEGFDVMGRRVTGAAGGGLRRLPRSPQQYGTDERGEQGQARGEDQAEVEAVEERLGQRAHRPAGVPAEIHPSHRSQTVGVRDAGDLLGLRSGDAGLAQMVGQGVDALRRQQTVLAACSWV
ncbi:hypothetical protein [Streptomyces soliscabiei]|uniref:hypothetical protein n=1 Tax=Streptomyces soliscabiei TaxID=588897 RepID=UPI0029B74433|nr:hypothetical protein [Streptomyces sp. NY05-11A]MDX2678245.1 hypothetical protein [Streptomyces sp. NY05-11A]